MSKKTIILTGIILCILASSCCVYAGNLVENEVGTIEGSIIGLDKADCANASVIAYNETNAYQSAVSSEGEYRIEDVSIGSYYIKIEVDGYHLPEPKLCKIQDDTPVELNFSITKDETGLFFYSWTADESYFGYEESASVPSEKEIVFDDEVLYISDTGAEKKLYDSFAVILCDDDEKWSNEYASRMLDLISKIYSRKQTHPSKWLLTSEHLVNDIDITYNATGDIIYISEDAFANAIPRTASLNGLSGTYYSNRLYNALLRYATHEGEDIEFIDDLLVRKYECSIIVDDYEVLTKDTTAETEEAFEQFHPEELLSILNMLAEMPEGYHKIEGLKYLVRRADGYPHPLYDAAAVSWPTIEEGYIEFMDSAFLASEVEDTYRLILHEKAHFLWQHVFSEKIKAAWCEVGGWYEDPNDPDGWSTTKETEFVTAYAHQHDPNEDMAESLAYYVLMPDRLESRSPEKYEFIRNYIMNGEIYLTQIREDLTFEVYNLYPDYNYPGRIVGVDIQVEGASAEDKDVTVTVTLDTNGDRAYGATRAYMRITSSEGTFYDLYLRPTDDSCSVLTGKLKISKYSATGYWYTDQIELTDQNQNQRFSGTGRFGWKLFIDNTGADVEKPQYIDGTLKVTLEPGVIDGHDMTYVVVQYKAVDNVEVDRVYCELANQSYQGYRITEYGIYDSKTQLATIRIPFTEYRQSGTYAVTYIFIQDTARNKSSYYFYPSNTGATPYVTFEYQSEQSDFEVPELDLNRIYLTAYPTHPENPNGETVVNITYFARDNLAGLDIVSYRLLDPLGMTHFEYHYHDNFYTTYFKGNPTVWKEYNINVILPEGSAPGKWGLLELQLADKAGNTKTYNFLEIIHFSVGDASGLYDISVVAGEAMVSVSTNMYYAGNEEIYGYAAVYDADGKLQGVSGYEDFTRGLQSFFFSDIEIDCDVEDIAYARVFIVNKQSLTPIFYKEKPCALLE